MPKTKTRRHSRRYKNKRGGEFTSDLDKLERGPTPKDITPFPLPADPLRDEKYKSLVISESFKRRPTSEVEEIFSKRPREEQEQEGMKNAEEEQRENMRKAKLEQLVGEYNQDMEPWTGEETSGGRKSRRHRRHRRKGRKSRKHRRSRRH